MSATTFQNYLQMRRRIPIRVWIWVRAVSVVLTLAEIVLLLTTPRLGLKIMWGVAVPLLPILFFLAPGVWRNICPLSASNQTPRLLGFTRGRAAPPWLKRYAYVIAVAGFTAFVTFRKIVFNTSGPASAAIIAFALVSAFVGGVLLRGKSGWCSSICPLLPVQRLYGQNPFVNSPNSHCQPCVGCVKNCYDFSPRAAYLADLADSDREFTGFRLFFAAAFPGLVLAFFEVPASSSIGVAALLGRTALYVAATVATFYALRTFVPVSDHKLTTLAAVAALNCFYWFAEPRIVATLGGGSPHADAVTWALRAILAALTVYWVLDTYRNESAFVQRASAPPEEPRAASRALSAVVMTHALSRSNQPEVTFADGTRALVNRGETLLEVAEANGKRLEAGCRMGVCGADPVCVQSGSEHLSPMSDDERATLERLGLADSTRLACCARVNGPVAVALEPEQAARPTDSQIAGFAYDREVEKVVVIGNGIAGVTAADHVRRRHPTCEIHLIGDEAHHLYNRMGIARLVYGRSAMQGLYLQADDWYEEHGITTWLNTRARAIDRERRVVALASGEELPYDRLVLATGGRGRVFPIPGFGIDGCFVMRSAGDAIGVRAFAQRYLVREAVVAGGGLLGIETADALHRLGIATTIIQPADFLLPRQLDERAAALLSDYLEGLGLRVMNGAMAVAVEGERRVRHVELSDGRRLDAGMYIVCAGIESNTELAREAGLDVNQGVVVDEHMRTSDPNIYAVGDVAEVEGTTTGLWPTAVDQAQVAATNLTGGEREYVAAAPATVLKVVGIELVSIGRITPAPDDEQVVYESEDGARYTKLIVAGGRIVGAIMLGYSSEVSPVTTAVRRGLDVSGVLDRLREGDLMAVGEVLEGPLVPIAAAGPGSG